MNDENIFYKLGECAEIGAGYPLRGAASKLDDGESGLIRLQNVSDGTRIQFDEVERVTLPKNRKSDFLSVGDIIFAARGTHNFAYHIPEMGFPAVCAPQFFVIKANQPEATLPKYLTWYLNSPPAQHYFDSVAVGTAMKNIRRTAVENLEVPIPSLPKQHAIVNLWETAIAEEQTLQSLIQNRKTLLAGLAQGLSRKGQ